MQSFIVTHQYYNARQNEFMYNNGLAGSDWHRHQGCLSDEQVFKLTLLTQSCRFTPALRWAASWGPCSAAAPQVRPWPQR